MKARGAGWRDTAATAIMVGCLSSLPEAERVLTVDDESGEVEAALRGRGVEVVAWRRFATGAGARDARPWPPEGAVDAALIRLPKGRDAQEMVFHAAASRVRPGGHLVLYGANDEGIRSMPKRMRRLFGDADTLDARKHCRVILSTRPAELDGLKATLAEWATRWTLEWDGAARSWLSYPGMFAHGRLDDGTKLLLKTLPELERPWRILDYGCGTGVIGAVVLGRCPGVTMDLLDIDALAVAAARENVPGARRVLLGDSLDAASGEPYQLILSNPPIHAGKGEDHSALERLIAQAPARLSRNGALQMVVQKRVDVRPMLEPSFREVTLVRENSRFRIWRAAKALR